MKNKNEHEMKNASDHMMEKKGVTMIKMIIVINDDQDDDEAVAL